VFYGLLIFSDFPVRRPIKRRAIVLVRVKILKFLLSKKRFMGIKSFYLKKPVICVLVPINKL
jgi:hypothetical protein